MLSPSSINQRGQLMSGWIGHQGLRFHHGLLLASGTFSWDELIEVVNVLREN